MNRRKFLGVTGGTVLVAGLGYYLLSDKKNFVRSSIKPGEASTILQDEKEILYLASLAPSGHNSQPWIIKYIEPYHWIISTDKSRWLPAVDPGQRETILSVGAFMQTLEYAASNYGYSCQWNMLATNNQDENIVEVKLNKSKAVSAFDITQIRLRRTIRSGYTTAILKKEDLEYLTREEPGYLHYIPNNSKENNLLNEQTIEANKIQAYRDAAQEELSDWIRFSGKEAEKHCDGLTTASMEIEGINGWIVRNFFGKKDVMKKSFRNKGIDNVREQVSQSAGWLIMTSNEGSVADLLEAGKRMQRIFLKVRKKGIALHPMTQILEEAQTKNSVNESIGINDKIQFLLRTGYVKNYPDPVSLRRPVDWFVKYKHI